MLEVDQKPPRAASRKSVMILANVRVRNGPTPAKIRNISTAGSMIEIETTVPRTEPFQLTRGSLTISARRVWSVGNRCGVSFNRSLDVAQWMREAP